MSIRGIDISHHNKTLDFVKEKSGGIEFCYLKATDGNAFTDPMFAYNKVNAPKAGILTGAYHFLRPNLDGADQANFFLKTSGHGLDLPPMLDWELSQGMRVSVQHACALAWLEAVEAATGKTPFIYTYVSYLQGLGDMSAFAKYPLWIAEYGVTAPKVFQPWGKNTIWQCSASNGRDLDVFYGTVDELKNMK